MTKAPYRVKNDAYANPIAPPIWVRNILRRCTGSIAVQEVKKFEYIRHTADIGLVAYGGNLPEAFANAAYGLFSIITDLRKVKAIESRAIDLQENDSESLLFEWLNHLIYLFEVDRILFKKCIIQEFDGFHLKATCLGEKIDPKRHSLKLGVKAATYHLLKVDPEKNEVRVIFDV